MNKELYSKAVQAGYNYRKVYGKFPERIGIHRLQMQQLDHFLIVFPVHPETKPTYIDGKPDFTNFRYSQHATYFDAIVGKDIEYDEVYVLVGDTSDQRVISGKTLATLAKER